MPEARAFLLAYNTYSAGRQRATARYRASVMPGMVLIDRLLLVHVMTLNLAGYGSVSQNEIVHAIDAPRRTIRDSLARLVNAGLMVRDSRHSYCASQAALDIEYANFEQYIKDIAVLCDAFTPYRRAIGR